MTTSPPSIPPSMLLVDLSPISVQIEAVSAEIRADLTEVNRFFNDFFIQKKQSITSDLAAYSQILADNSGCICVGLRLVSFLVKVEAIKAKVSYLADEKTKMSKELENEHIEISAATKGVKELSEQREKISLHLSELCRKIDDVASKLAREKDSKIPVIFLLVQNHRSKAKANAIAKDKPEAEFYKSLLGLEIEALRVVDVSTENYSSIGLLISSTRMLASCPRASSSIRVSQGKKRLFSLSEADSHGIQKGHTINLEGDPSDAEGTTNIL